MVRYWCIYTRELFFDSEYKTNEAKVNGDLHVLAIK